MIFKCGSFEPINSFSIILAEFVSTEIEIKLHIIQIIANDFNGFTNMCFRNVCVLLFVIFLEFFCIYSPFRWLTLTNGKSYWFHCDFLVNLSRIILLKANDF